jgi:integrase
MKHILKINGRYYYNRRVPEELLGLDERRLIRVALKTDSRDLAIRKAHIYNEQVEKYWKKLIQTGQHHTQNEYQKVIHIARAQGFAYMPNEQLATMPPEQIAARLILVGKENNDAMAKALLGGVQPTALELSELLAAYWPLVGDKAMHKSPNQLRKYKAPRIKAMTNFIALTGNRPLIEVTREHILAFRAWWIERIETHKMSAGSANKDFIHVKSIIEAVNEHMKLGLDTLHLFRKITLQDRFAQARVPFETEFIRDILLNHDNLAGLNYQAKWFLFAMAETGARISELTGLRPIDIILDAEVPHISIVDRPDKPLKTPHSQRKIPLVGFALDAFKACPDGFPNYHDRPDSLSGLLNKYLREHGLLPSDKHSVYSLRHSFQDRILSVNAPDRIQAELMGHKFQRPMYGDGATLAHKLEWMEKVRVKIATA